MSLKNDDSNSALKRKEEMDKEISSLAEKKKELEGLWQAQKAVNDRIKEDKKLLDKNNLLLEKYMQDANYLQAAKIQNEIIPALKKKIETEKEQNKNENLISDVVTSDTVALIISSWTRIPVAKLTLSEKSKILSLPNELKKRVIGQDEAIKQISDSILRNRAGLSDGNKPIGSFLFLGPTGVGKTEVAKALAEQLFDSEKHIIRIDMSEYMEKYSVSRLIGAAPGYVGHEQGGQLTEQVRRNPYSIVLFDEIEKAHPDVFNILLQVLDDGRLTDSLGTTVDFTNCIIIMTSNLGSQYLLNGNSEKEKSQVMDLLKKTFRPEFLNRIDEIIMFNSLSKEVGDKIIEKFLNQLKERLENRDIAFSYDKKAVDYLSRYFDDIYGARPLKRAIQNEVEDRIAYDILADKIVNKVSISADDHLLFKEE